MLLPLPFRKTGSETDNAAYLKKALAKSLTISKLKRHRLSFQNWFLFLDDSLWHTTTFRPRVPGGERCQDDPPPTLFTRYRHTDFFLCPRMKQELAGLQLFQDSFMTSWVGVKRTITKDEFTTTFGSDLSAVINVLDRKYLDKSWEINTFPTQIIVLIPPCTLTSQ